jgi:hypothetical protein
MNSLKFLEPITLTFARSSRFTKITMLVLGGAAFALWRSRRGRDWMRRTGKSLGSSMGRQIGQLAGGELGAHPVRTAEMARQARHLVSSART